MTRHRQICHGVEFQIMRVDTLPPKRWSVTPVSPGAGCTERFPAKGHGLDGEAVTLKWKCLASTTSAQ